MSSSNNYYKVRKKRKRKKQPQFSGVSSFKKKNRWCRHRRSFIVKLQTDKKKKVKVSQHGRVG